MPAFPATQTEILPASVRATSMLDALHIEASSLNLTPGWLPREKPILWTQPKSELAPAHWSYEAAKAILDGAGPLIDLSLAERRVLGFRFALRAIGSPGNWTPRYRTRKDSVAIG
jgi:gentisate 1,2-dioxygenase